MCKCELHAYFRPLSRYSLYCLHIYFYSSACNDSQAATLSSLFLSYFFLLFYYSIHTSLFFFFFFSSRRRHTRFDCDWSSDVCSSDLSVALRKARLLFAVSAVLSMTTRLLEPLL